jgi:hypothetical protein
MSGDSKGLETVLRNRKYKTSINTGSLGGFDIGESEHRCYLCGLADGLAYALKVVTDAGGPTGALKDAYDSLREARMIELHESFFTPVESLEGKLLDLK